jgi:adenosylcobinamide-phosphate synthase
VGNREAWSEQAKAHPSPNAGVVEAAFAGALGIELGGTLAYAGRIEHRPVLNPGGRAAGPRDVARAIRLARRISIITAVIAAVGSRR